MTFKGILNLIAGEMLMNGGPDWVAQQFHIAICMITANPFLG